MSKPDPHYLAVGEVVNVVERDGYKLVTVRDAVGQEAVIKVGCLTSAQVAELRNVMLAAELCNAFHDASGDTWGWGDLLEGERPAWLAVAKKAKELLP